MKRPYPLDQSPLYCLQSRRRLAAEVLGLPLPKLESLVTRTDNYRQCIRVTGGKQRIVHVPQPLLCALHRRLAVLLNRMATPSYLQSGQRRPSHLTNAREHANASNIAKFDIRHFYPSITKDRVWHFFADRMLCSGDVASLLARLLTHQGSTPIGSPVSQVLAFHVVRPLLDELHNLARQNGLRFTCYVDDLTFSGTGASQEFVVAASNLVRRYGFTPHADHCYGPSEDKLVTGVLLTTSGLRVPPAQLQSIDTARRRLAQSADDAGRLPSLASLIGHLAAAVSIDTCFQTELRQRCVELRRLKERFPSLDLQSDSKGMPAAPRLRPTRLSYGGDQ